jgi:hypothetical protein
MQRAISNEANKTAEIPLVIRRHLPKTVSIAVMPDGLLPPKSQ